MCEPALFVERPGEALTAPQREEFVKFPSYLIFWILIIGIDRPETLIQILLLGLALQIKREVPQHPIEIGKELAYLRLILPLPRTDTITEAQHKRHVLECLLVDVADPTSVIPYEL